MKIDLQHTLNEVIKIARRTGEFIRHEGENFDRSKIQEKGLNNLVSYVDMEAEKMIVQTLKFTLPEAGFITEEGTETEKAEIYNWVVDPLDGTTNFSLGLHYWGTSIARLVDGWPQVSALYYPMFDELYSAQLGQGAAMNGESLQTKLPDKSMPTSFFSCCSRTFRRYDVKVRYKTRILGAASYTLCAVARGSAILGFEATPKIWDIAGGWLVVTEAGGQVDTLDSSEPFPLLPGLDYGECDYPILAAATPGEIAKARLQIKPRSRA